MFTGKVQVNIATMKVHECIDRLPLMVNSLEAKWNFESQAHTHTHTHTHIKLLALNVRDLFRLAVLPYHFTCIE